MVEDYILAVEKLADNIVKNHVEPSLTEVFICQIPSEYVPPYLDPIIQNLSELIETDWFC
jgi:hypothetical protein